jgi:glutaredoxin-like protein NrdH
MTKKHLARRGIPYTEIPINDAGVLEAIHELDFHTAPVVCAATTAGEQAWDGYRPDRIDALAGVR